MRACWNTNLGEWIYIDVFRTRYPNAEEYTFFSSAHGTLSRINHTLGYTSNLSKFNKIEIISSTFSEHNTIRLNINYKKKTAKKKKERKKETHGD